MNNAPECLECGKRAGRFVTGALIYPHRPDLADKRIYQCRCGATVGCHKDSGAPLGRPAGRETRAARGEAHAAFDPLWQSGLFTRRDAYRWLSKVMRMDFDRCHIGGMSKGDAQRVAYLCRILH